MKLSVADRTAAAIIAVSLGVVAMVTAALLWEFRASLIATNDAAAGVLGRAVGSEVRRRGEVLTAYLARSLADPLYRFDLETIGRAVAAARQQPDVAFVHVFDKDGRIVHDGTRELALLDQVPGDPVGRRAATTDRLVVQDGDDALDVAAPIVVGEQRIGAVRVGLSLARLRAEQAALVGHIEALGDEGLRQAWRAVGLMSAIVLLVGCVAALGVGRALTRPLAELATYAQRVGEGQYGPPPALERTDELGALASAFHQATEQRSRAEAELAARNRELLLARDAAVEASRAKTVFLATMSHELRTPLNHIIGYAGMMAEEIAEGGQPELGDARRVEASAKALLEIVQGVLDLAKIESDRMTVMLQRVHLVPLVEEAVRAARHPVEANGNRLDVVVDPLLAQERFTTDPGAVTQVLGRLLSNAAKFTRNGAVAVEAVLEDGHARLSVKDTGVGIRADQIERIFLPFTQADEDAARMFEGAGLGLAISRGLSRLVGGELTVESEDGVGSVFTLRLPRGTPDGWRRPDQGEDA